LQREHPVAELLRQGFDVYMTLVDDQQNDCIVRQEKNGQPEAFHYGYQAQRILGS